MKKIAFLIVTCANIAFSMDNNPDFQQWVKNCSEIQVKCKIAIDSIIRIPISDETTVADIKQEIFKKKQIPAEAHILSVLYKSLWHWNYTAQDVDDTQSIKSVMNTFNTDLFAVRFEFHTSR